MSTCFQILPGVVSMEHQWDTKMGHQKWDTKNGTPKMGHQNWDTKFQIFPVVSMGQFRFQTSTSACGNAQRPRLSNGNLQAPGVQTSVDSKPGPGPSAWDSPKPTWSLHGMKPKWLVDRNASYMVPTHLFVIVKIDVPCSLHWAIIR